MHRLVLGAFWHGDKHTIDGWFSSLNAPFGARCFLTDSTPEEYAKILRGS